MKVLTNQEKQRQRYAIIYNEYGSSALANIYKKRSDAHIFSDLGLKIPQKSNYIRPTKRFTNQEKARRNRQLLVYITKRYRLVPELALKESRKERGKYSRKYTELKEKLQKKEIDPIVYYTEKIIDNRNLYKKRDERSERWKKWSSYNKKGQNKFPYFLKNFINSININENQDINEPYGYCVAYQMYVNNYSLEDALKFVEPDEFTGYIYTIDYQRKKRRYYD